MGWTGSRWAADALLVAPLLAAFTFTFCLPLDDRSSEQPCPSQLPCWLHRFASTPGYCAWWSPPHTPPSCLAWPQDKVGNIVIYRPGSGGGEKAPPVIIQGAPAWLQPCSDPLRCGVAARPAAEFLLLPPAGTRPTCFSSLCLFLIHLIACRGRLLRPLPFPHSPCSAPIPHLAALQAMWTWCARRTPTSATTS